MKKQFYFFIACTVCGFFLMIIFVFLNLNKCPETPSKGNLLVLLGAVMSFIGIFMSLAVSTKLDIHLEIIDLNEP
jgi:hypothetical protein